MSLPRVEVSPDTRTTSPGRVWIPTPWLDESAVCAQVDPEVFHPTRDCPWTVARDVCLRCPLQPECAMHAIEHREHGVWGGTSEKWRGRLRKRTSAPAQWRAEVDAVAAANPVVQRQRLHAAGDATAA